MAYEAYIATVNQIAERALAEWLQGNDTEPVLQRGAKDHNVELHHCRNALTRLINARHLDSKLTPAI
jgi:hypothetical protein